MANFQAVNFGDSFLSGMRAMTGMMNDQRQLDLTEREQAGKEESRRLANEHQRLVNENQSMVNEDAAREAKARKMVQGVLDIDARRRLPGYLDDPQTAAKDVSALTGILSDTPYLWSDPARIPEWEQKTAGAMAAVSKTSTLPPGKYGYSRADNIPEVNATLDSIETMLSPERFKEFTDVDGRVTGVKGGKYRTVGVGGFTVVSGEGDKAWFAPHLDIVGENGKPIFGADGRPVQVPATTGQGNGPDDKVVLVDPREMYLKMGWGRQVTNLAKELGMTDSVKGRGLVESALRAARGPKGAEEWLKAIEAENKENRKLEALRAQSRQTAAHIAGLRQQLQSGQITPEEYDWAAAQALTDSGVSFKDAAEGVKKLREPAAKPEIKSLFSKPVRGGSIPPELLGGAKVDPGKYYVGIERNGATYFAETQPDDNNMAKTLDKLIATFVLNNSMGDIRDANRQSGEAEKSINESQGDLTEMGIVGGANVTEEDLQRPEVKAAALKGKKAFDAQTGAMEKADLARGTIGAVVGKGMSPRQAYNGREKPKPPQARTAPEPQSTTKQPTLSSARPIKSQPGKHLLTLSDGSQWIGTKGARGWQLETRATVTSPASSDAPTASIQNGRIVVSRPPLENFWRQPPRQGY